MKNLLLASLVASGLTLSTGAWAASMPVCAKLVNGGNAPLTAQVIVGSKHVVSTITLKANGGNNNIIYYSRTPTGNPTLTFHFISGNSGSVSVVNGGVQNDSKATIQKANGINSKCDSQGWKITAFNS